MLGVVPRSNQPSAGSRGLTHEGYAVYLRVCAMLLDQVCVCVPVVLFPVPPLRKHGRGPKKIGKTAVQHRVVLSHNPMMAGTPGISPAGHHCALDPCLDKTVPACGTFDSKCT